MTAQGRLPSDIDLEKIKKLVVIAMFSDDELMDRLVLKGGNALDLVHRISMRSSIDVDLSMPDDFPVNEREAIRKRVEDTLRKTFREAGYEVFDVTMEERPEGMTPDMADFWGGYDIEFKLISMVKFGQLKNIKALRRNALQMGQGKKFLINISRFEYTKGKEALNLDGYRIFVYSAEMMVCEKLRAICQQMREYGPVIKRSRTATARARDFLDIYTVMENSRIDLGSAENKELLSAIFKAKKVPLELLGLVEKYRDFHRTDFPALAATVKAGVELKGFDFYFEFVLGLIDKLKPLWNV